MAAGGPVPPGPIASGVDAEAAIIDAVLFFVPEDAGPGNCGMNDVGFFLGYLDKVAGIAIHPGVAHAITTEAQDRGSADEGEVTGAMVNGNTGIVGKKGRALNVGGIVVELGAARDP